MKHKASAQIKANSDYDKPTSGLLQILPSLSISDRPLVAKGIDFKFKTATEKSGFAKVSVCFCKIIFCPISWFIY